MKLLNMTHQNWIFFVLLILLVTDIQGSALKLPAQTQSTPTTQPPQHVPTQNVQPQPFQSQIVDPQTLQPQNVQPQTLDSQVAQPQTVQPQTMQPQTVQPQTVQPQTVQPQTVQPQMVQPQVDPQKGIKSLIAMMVGCELDNECLRLMLNQVIQNDPDPIYQGVLTFLQGQKNDPNCRTPEIIAVKKATASCLGDLINQSNISSLSNNMNTCFKNKMETLAKDKNIFAEYALLNIARKTNDTQSINGWNAMIQAEVGTSQYAAYQKCPSPFELLEQLSTVMGQQRPNMTVPPNVRPLSPQQPQFVQPKSTTPKMPAIR